MPGAVQEQDVDQIPRLGTRELASQLCGAQIDERFDDDPLDGRRRRLQVRNGLVHEVKLERLPRDSYGRPYESAGVLHDPYLRAAFACDVG